MMEKTDFDVVVVGAGIVGLATAYKISQRYPGIRLAVLEKERQVASGQTGHNSGVIHSGLYYEPGSVKARTCTAGRKALVAFAKEHNIAHKICGKIIVATKETELSRLEQVFQNGLANKIEGIEQIGPQQIKEIEPHCAGLSAIYVPCTGVIDFVQVALKLAELIEAKPSRKVLTSHAVLDFEKQGGQTSIPTPSGRVQTRYVINCAGLQSDRIATMDGVQADVRIIPFRGDYFELTEQAAENVKALVYPVPDPTFPFLGVHFTHCIDGRVECGPNAVFSFKKEGYGKTDFDFRDTWASLSFAGTWRLFAKHWRYGLGEYTRAFCKRAMLKQLRRLLPSLELDDLVPGKSGVRAQAVSRTGEPIDDFKIVSAENSIHTLNAPSPAATACLAIGAHIADLAESHFNLT